MHYKYSISKDGISKYKTQGRIMKFYDRNKELELTTTLRLVYLLDCKPTLTYTIRAVGKSEGLSDYRRGCNPRLSLRQNNAPKGRQTANRT